MKKKLIFGVLGVAFIIAITGCIWIWRNKNNNEMQNHQSGDQALIENSNTQTIDISNWKTYKNNEFGFEIKYPINWEEKISLSTNKEIIKIINIERRDIIGNNDYNNKSIPDGDYSFNITIYNQDSSSAINFINYLKYPEEFSRNVNFGNKVILSDGNEALKNVIQGPGKTFNEQRGNNIAYCFIKNEKYYEIAILYDGNDMSNGIGEKIFSTMKFVK